MSNLEYVWIDLCIVLPLVIAMGNTSARPDLTTTRPAKSLLSPWLLLSVVGHGLIQAVWQWRVLGWAEERPWFVPLSPAQKHSPTSATAKCMESTVLFYYSQFQYLFVAAAVSLDCRFRRHPITNRPFAITWLVLMTLCVLLVAVDSDALKHQFDLFTIPRNFRLQMLLVAAANFLTTMLFERLVFALYEHMRSRRARAAALEATFEVGTSRRMSTSLGKTSAMQKRARTWVRRFALVDHIAVALATALAAVMVVPPALFVVLGPTKWAKL